MRLLVIEDDGNIAFAIERYFGGSGHEVTCCRTLEEARAVDPRRQDFIILDVNLPDGNGFDYLSDIRSEATKTPLLMLTVRDSEKDIVRGLEMGADDYLTKPFSLSVLKARIETILRRSMRETAEDGLRCGPLRLDIESKMAFVEEEALELSAKEYELLELFMENQGLTLPRDRILDRLWGWERGDVFDNTLSVTVKRLREKIAPYQGFIRTIRGIGYRMTEGEE